METTIVLVLFGAFLVLLAIGAPITVALGVSAFLPPNVACEKSVQASEPIYTGEEK